MKKFEKFNRVAWISYFAIIVLNILTFQFILGDDGAGGWFDLFLVNIGILIIATAIFTFICALHRGAHISVFLMPVIFFCGSFVKQIMTWNMLWYSQEHNVKVFQTIETKYAINAFIATSAALALGLGVHYAVKYFKKSRATA